MLVINRNGKTVMLTGWRAWLATAAMSLFAAFALVLVIVLALGLTITIGAIAVFVALLAAVIALLAAGRRALIGR